MHDPQYNRDVIRTEMSMHYCKKKNLDQVIAKKKDRNGGL